MTDIKMKELCDYRYDPDTNFCTDMAESPDGEYYLVADVEKKLAEITETAKERFDAIQNYEKQNLRLVIENNKMREALEFYAGEKNHTSCTVKVMNHYETPIEYDLGKRAREALRHKL